MKSVDAVGEAPAKPAAWIPSSECVAEEMSVKCDATRRHVHLVGNRAKACEVYPSGVIHAVL